MDLKTLRASRKSDFSKITAEFEKDGKPAAAKSYEDTRFWKPERDKAGNATATIRFLNRTEGDELPWVKIFSHGFKSSNGRWFIDNCSTTLGGVCPVCETNTRLWNSTTDDNSPQRKQAREQKRKLNYIANILVVNDPKHPEHNGQVFLFKFGKKIFDMIMDKARPTFEDEDPVNVFDYWEGANFKLRMKKADGYPNYDSSDFEGQSPIADSDEDIVAIVNKQYSLGEFVAPANFKSYDELKKKLDTVLSGAPVTDVTAESLAEDDQPKTKPAIQPKSKPASQPQSKAPPSDDDDEDMMSYFQSIADED